MASEAEIAAQIRRGSRTDIHLDHRPAMSKAAEGVEVMKDSQFVRPEAKAEVLAPGEGNIPTPPGATTLSRRSEIRVEKGVEIGVDAKGPDEVSTISHVGGQAKAGSASTREPTFAARPQPSDPEMDIGAQAGVTQEYSDPLKEAVVEAHDEAEHIRGIPAYKADPSELSRRGVKTQEKIAEVIAVPQAAECVEEAKVVEAPKSTSPRPELDEATKVLKDVIVEEVAVRARVEAEQVAAAKGLKKETVVLSSPTMGRVRAKVGMVAVSETVIVLGYLDDDETTIVEPPISGSETTIGVKYKDHEYQCHYYGFTFEMLLPTFGEVPMLMVVLVRAKE